jgi:hypothetical protein
MLLTASPSESAEMLGGAGDAVVPMASMTILRPEPELHTAADIQLYDIVRRLRGR